MRPIVKGPIDGNIFAVLAAAKEALRKAGQKEKAEEMATRVFCAGSYGEALVIVSDYVEFQLGE
jgi:hypothetical protein